MSNEQGQLNAASIQAALSGLKALNPPSISGSRLSFEVNDEALQHVVNKYGSRRDPFDMAELRTEASRFLGIDDPLPNGASPAPTAAAAAPQQPILPTSTNGEGKFSVSSARPDATSEANGVLSTAPLATEREHEREGETEALCARVASTTGLAEDDPAYVAFRARHPCPLAEWAAFRRHTRGKQFIVFLDYDGTLTPIVSDPDRALLSEEMRAIVRRLAARYPTAIISGRGREKVESFVALPELFYAGSHGMDIVGPAKEGDRSRKAEVPFQPALPYVPRVNAIHDEMIVRTREVPGSSVEHNKFCVSVHFRNCDPSDHDRVERMVDEVVGKHEGMKVTRGRKVFEVRPALAWDKGQALSYLMEAFGAAAREGVMPLYIGDDKTDEDAFTALAKWGGAAVLVSSIVKPTAAGWCLRDPSAVGAFLARLVDMGEEEGAPPRFSSDTI